MDGSQKLPQRLLGTIEDCLAADKIPAGLCLAMDDLFTAELAADPRLRCALIYACESIVTIGARASVALFAQGYSEN